MADARHTSTRRIFEVGTTRAIVRGSCGNILRVKFTRFSPDDKDPTPGPASASIRGGDRG